MLFQTILFGYLCMLVGHPVQMNISTEGGTQFPRQWIRSTKAPAWDQVVEHEQGLWPKQTIAKTDCCQDGMHVLFCKIFVFDEAVYPALKKNGAFKIGGSIWKMETIFLSLFHLLSRNASYLAYGLDCEALRLVNVAFVSLLTIAVLLNRMSKKKKLYSH